jgi:hypothetical protein
MRTSLLLGATLCAPFLAVCLHAQVLTGTVNGIARDSQEKSISGARVQATDIARQTTRETRSELPRCAGILQHRNTSA